MIYSLFQLVDLFIVSSLGSGVVVLVGGMSTAFSVFSAFLDGARLAIVQDASRAHIRRKYLQVIGVVGLIAVLLFVLLISIWFPSVAGPHDTHYNLVIYQAIAAGQALFMMSHYMLTGILYGNYKEKWITYATLIGSIGQNLLTALFVFTSVIPVPKYLSSVTSSTTIFGMEVLFDLFLLRTIQSEGTGKEQAHTTIISFLRSALPISIERVGVFLGFLLVFSIIADLPSDSIAGYVFIARTNSLAFLSAYGVEVILTREISKSDTLATHLQLLKMAITSALILGGCIIMLVYIFHTPLIHLELSSVKPQSVALIKTALFIALGFQFANFTQIVVSGFLRASGLKMFISGANIAVFMIALPLGLQLLQRQTQSLSLVWLVIGMAYILALLVFSLRLFAYIRQYGGRKGSVLA